MTVAELINLARDVLNEGVHIADRVYIAKKVSRAIVDLLGEAQPCGWEAPDIVPRRDDHNSKIDGYWVGVPEEWVTEYLEPDEARALARMLLVAADEADQAAKERSE